MNSSLSTSKKRHLPEHPRIASADLVRLTLDQASARRFDRRFLPVLFGGIFLGCASLLAGYLLQRFGTVSSELGVAVGAAGTLPGLTIAFAVHRRMLHARPWSVHSGQRMVPFVIQDREQTDLIVIAYIDETSGTYFTRSYVA